MTSSTTGRLAWCGGAACLAALASAAALTVAHGGAIAWLVVWSVAALGCAGTGAVLCLRVPRNPIAWIFLTVGLVLALGLAGDAYALAAHGARAAAIVTGYVGESFPVAALPTVLLVFPSGQLPSRRWRPVGIAWVAIIAVLVLNTALAPGTLVLDSGLSVVNPAGLGGTPGSVVGGALVAVPVFVLLIAAAAASLVRRYRKATGDLRQQLKWFGAGGTLLALAAALIPVLGSMGAPWSTVVLDSIWAVAIDGLVVATGVAVLRHRLYDIDVVIRRTLVYTALIGSLAAVYLAGVYVMGRALEAVVGHSGTLAVTLSTLAVAAMFQPLRGWIQHRVDRRFYRGRYDAAATLDAFARRLRGQIDLDALHNDVLEVVRATLQPEHTSLAVLRPSTPADARTPGGRWAVPGSNQ